MLTDPFVLKAPSLAAHTALTAYNTLSLPRVQEQGGTAQYGPVLTNSSVLGKSVTMRISHSKSNENKPVQTNRVLVRIDLTGVNADGQEGVAFAYAVVGMPEKTLHNTVGAAVAGDDPVTDVFMLQLLIGALAVSNSAVTLDETRIARLLNGES
jgi:hypothetical protein